MPHKTFEQISVEELCDCISCSDGQPEFNICPEFQRGTEAKGVWSLPEQKAFIKSINSNMPCGAITIVRERPRARRWSILDGGNRTRAIRDYRDNKFAAQIGENFDERKFESLSEGEQSDLKNKRLTLEKVTILPSDSDDIIARMYCALNSNGKKLCAGELLKAWGWKGTIPIINLAKELMEEDSEFHDASEEDESSDSESADKHGEHGAHSDVVGNNSVSALRQRWKAVIGKAPSPRPRSKTLAYMIGLIASSVSSDRCTDNTRLCGCNYRDLMRSGKLTSAPLSPEHRQKVLQDLHLLLTFLDGVFGKVYYMKSAPGGCPPIKLLAAVWAEIVTGRMSPRAVDVFKRFYLAMSDPVLHAEFKATVDAKGDGHITPKKIGGIKKLILDWASTNGQLSEE